MQEAGPNERSYYEVCRLGRAQGDHQQAVADDGVAPVPFGTIANDATAVRKAVSQLKRGGKLVAAYEAGPTGYGLHRQLTQLGADWRRGGTGADSPTRW